MGKGHRQTILLFALTKKNPLWRMPGEKHEADDLQSFDANVKAGRHN
jgi:hypothetical protein